MALDDSMTPCAAVVNSYSVSVPCTAVSGVNIAYISCYFHQQTTVGPSISQALPANSDKSDNFGK